jgi:predicted phage gp36 major capsid-like protein
VSDRGLFVIETSVACRLRPDTVSFHPGVEALVKTAPELQSEARSNHDAAARALRMALGQTRPSEVERLERFAAELESRAKELDAQAASAAQAAVDRG